MGLWNNPPYYLTAYGLAVKHGFSGTEEQWLESLKGDPGEDLKIERSFDSYAEMIEYYLNSKPDGFVMVGSTENYLFYYWDAYAQEWRSLAMQGRTGETGAAATIAVGTVTTLDAGEEATVENSGSSHAAVFNFGIPAGANGVSVTGFDLVRGTHAAGTVDTYYLRLSNGTNIPVYIYNGADGIGAGDMVKSVYDPRNLNRDIFQAIEEAVAASVTSVNGETGDVTVNHVALADNLYSIDNQEIYDGYIFRTSGGSVSIDNGEASLTAIYGNTEVEGRVPMSLRLLCSNQDLQLSINAETWRQSSPGGASGSYPFVYDTDHWEYSGSTVNLTDYGISLLGTPATGDTITVNYTVGTQGTLRVARPTAFKAIGLNQFDKDNNVLSGYSFDSNGDVVPNANAYLCWIHAVGGLEDGYTVYSENNAVLRIGWFTEIPDTATTGIEVLSSDVGLSHVAVDESGYLCVVTTDIDTLCVHPTWSGYEDYTYEAYSESVIAIPTADAEGAPLPTASYGMPSVGTVRDELSLDLKRYTQRIARLTYSAANLETVQAMGVDYDYDASYIYYVMTDPIVYSLASGVSGAYTAADFGTEEFLGTNVAVYAQNVYGQNLRDKLRTDVLTISRQTLTAAQQTQARENIGAMPLPLVFENVTVQGESEATVSVTGNITDAAVVAATFETQITASGSYVFEYDGTDWHLGETTVTLADYGITVTGTPADGDTVTVVYTASPWETDATYADFPYRATVPLTGVTAAMMPQVIFDVAEATSGDYAPVEETYTGGVYIWAASVPGAAITIPTIICWRV